MVTIKTRECRPVTKNQPALIYTDYIKNDVSNGYAWAAFKFANIGYSSVSFSSAESVEFAPYLSVAGVPEPATLALLGLGGIAFLRRRK